MPKVSVVIPTYNRLPMMNEAVESVLSQDVEDLELIVVDDCSTDNTVNIVKTCCDARVRCVVLEKNSGLKKKLKERYYLSVG